MDGEQVEMTVKNPFNSPFEAGVRSTIILFSAFPNELDLQKLVVFDYLTVHSKDADGPESLHAPVPLRSGELLVRRNIIERGVNLMMSRYLIERKLSHLGITYRAAEGAGSFISTINAPYTEALKARAEWAVQTYGGLSIEGLNERTATFLRRWNAEFETQAALGQPL
jgi:hypothetical protein